jgi:hypothetical protein
MTFEGVPFFAFRMGQAVVSVFAVADVVEITRSEPTRHG